MKSLLIATFLLGSSIAMASDCTISFKNFGTDTKTMNDVLTKKGFEVKENVDGVNTNFRLSTSVGFGPLGEVVKSLYMGIGPMEDVLLEQILIDGGKETKSAFLALESGFLASLPNCN